MSKYDLDYYREMLKYVSGISFLMIATSFALFFFGDFRSVIIDSTLKIFILPCVFAGWLIVVIDIVFMLRGNDDA